MIGLALQVGAAFNLICSITSVANHHLTHHERQVFRVDLRSMQFCIDECSQVLGIFNVNENEITFADAPGADAGSYFSRRVNRLTGDIIERVAIPPPATSNPGEDVAVEIIETGHCDPARFTGFPGRRF